MKKSLVLAMAMALGVTASAYAANPFSDVPAGHWAYDSISKLAAAGVIEGYGDDTFRGDRLMTRYEMAQIVAKAMAKGANVDKLAAEFADELDALGVRVAALEKKSDNVKIAGNIRYRWMDNKRDLARQRKNVTHDLRTRLTVTGTVNDNWNYVGRFQNVQNFRNYIGDDTSYAWHIAHVNGRIGGVKVKAGRYHEALAGGDSDVYEDRIDALKLMYGDKVRISAYYGKPTAANTAVNYWKKALGFKLEGDLGKSVTLYGGLDRFFSGNNALGVAPFREDSNLWHVGLKAQLGKDVKAEALYLHNKTDEDVKKNGFTFALNYKGANPAKKGTWGIGAKYYNQGDGTYFSHGFDADRTQDLNGGFKGFRVSANYTFDKGIVGNIHYYDFKAKEGNDKSKTLFTSVVFTF
jgi:hypothetical protein